MVSNRIVSLLGLIALVAMFLKLPEVIGCKSCFSPDPFKPLLAAAYFATLVAFSLLFPAPNRHLARGGLIGVVLLALILTYLNLPGWCTACLVAHTCNIAIWSIWAIAPPKAGPNWGPKVCLLLFAPISVVALFSSLNLTFMAYGSKPKISLHKGDPIPLASIVTADGRSIALTEKMILNFVAPDCPHCKEQLQTLRELPSRIVNISPILTPELIQLHPTADWIEDKEGRLQKLFKVHGYPTLYEIENQKITRVVLGVSSNKS